MGKPRNPKHTTASLTSKRVMSMLLGSDGTGHSDSHLATVRKAVAELTLQTCIQKHKTRPPSRVHVLHLSMDETEMPFSLQSANEIAQLLMLQGLSCKLYGNSTACIRDNLLMAPCVSTFTNAPTIFPAALARLLSYGTLSEMAAETDMLVFIVNSDSHPAMGAGYRHFPQLFDALGLENASCAHTKCNTHMLCTCMTDLLGLCKLLNGTFCSTLQFHKGKNLAGMRSRMKARVRKTKIKYSRNGVSPDEFSKAVLYLLRVGDSEFHPYPSDATPATKRRRKDNTAMYTNWKRMTELFAHFDGGGLF